MKDERLPKQLGDFGEQLMTFIIGRLTIKSQALK